MIPALIARPLKTVVLSEIVAGEDAQLCEGTAFCVGDWATVRGGSGTTYDFSRTNSAYFIDIQDCATTDQYQSITRVGFVFDLSGESGTKVGAKLRLRVNGKAETITGQEVAVTSFSPASTTTLVNTDYALVGTTAYSPPTALSAISSPSTVELTLNAAALTAINSAVGVGNVSMAIRIESDRADSEPAWGSGNKAQLNFYSRNWGTASQRPTLVIW